MPVPNFLAAGRLRHRVTIQRNTPVKNGYGQSKENWADVATLFAEVIPLAGRELVNARQVVPLASHRVTVRTSIPILPSDRLRFQGRILNIGSVLRIREIGIFYEITCIEPVAITTPPQS